MEVIVFLKDVKALTKLTTHSILKEIIEINESLQNGTQIPSKKHFYISLVKSGVRIMAGIALCTGSPLVAGLLLIGAELLGILEEL